MTKRAILIGLIVLNLTTIFLFSHQDAASSGRISSGITNQIKVHTPHYAEKTEAQQKVVHTQTQYLIRGLAHGILFFSLGILFLMLLRTFCTRWYMSVISLLVGFLAAWCDEVHQLYVPGRSFGWDDILYDMSGFLFGTLTVLLIAGIKNLLQKKKL